MSTLSAVQEAQRDNLRSFDDYMLQVPEDDWQKESESMLSSFDDSDDSGALRISLQSLRFQRLSFSLTIATAAILAVMMMRTQHIKNF